MRFFAAWRRENFGLLLPLLLELPGTFLLSPLRLSLFAAARAEESELIFVLVLCEELVVSLGDLAINMDLNC